MNDHNRPDWHRTGSLSSRLLNSRRRPTISWPLLILLIGISTILIFTAYRNDLRNVHRLAYGFHHLTVAVNLSPDHSFLGFTNQSVDAEGNINYRIDGEIFDRSDYRSYYVYNRFPPGGYALIKLVTLPFEDLASPLHAAQILMLVLFAGAMVLAYGSLCRLTSSRWIALTATLVVFSSTIILPFSTAILTEGGPDFFGFMLAFHGMAIFAQEGRFRQLVIKSCIALLLGWHVLALLFVFILFSLTKEVLRIRAAMTVREIVVVAVSSRYFILGTIAFGFAILILTYNIGIEYYALNIRTTLQYSLSDLPTIHSISTRTEAYGLNSTAPLGQFWLNQFTIIGYTVVPFVLSDIVWRSGDYLVSSVEPVFYSMNIGWMIHSPKFYMGVLTVGTCIVGVFRVRHRLLAATAVLSGFCWAIPMRQNVHEQAHEHIYYVGVYLFFCVLILLFIRKLMSKQFMPFVVGPGLLILALSGSNYESADTEYDSKYPTEFQESMMDDFDAIRTFTKGKNVLVPISSGKWTTGVHDLTGTAFVLHYYLSGSRILFNDFGCERNLDWADFMINIGRDEGPGLLTANNRIAFLYDRHVHDKYMNNLVESRDPVVRGDFDVYLTDDRRLVYVSDRCDEASSGSLFLGVPISLFIYPVDAADLPDSGEDREFHELTYIEHFVMDAERHVVIFDLPDYDIASITTGQYDEKGRIWDGSFFGPDHEPDADLLAQADRAAAAGGAIRGRFNVYLSGDESLLYVKEPCDSADVSDVFFVHVTPADSGDLPEHRRELGFDNLDFVFFDRGTSDGVRCAAEIELPDYDIAGITTGQYTDQGRTWQNEISPPEG